MEFRGTGRKIYDGSETGIPYLHGVVVREDFAKEYPEIVVAFIKAVYEAGEWIKADPMRAVELMEKWSGVEKEVLYLYFSNGGYLTLDPTIKPNGSTPEIGPRRPGQGERASGRSTSTTGSPRAFVRTAYKNLGLNYDAENGEDGRSGEGQRRTADGDLACPRRHQDLSNMAEFLKAVAEFKATGVRLNATYVYDKETGLKLFGKTAFFVKAADGEFPPSCASVKPRPMQARSAARWSPTSRPGAPSPRSDRDPDPRQPPRVQPWPLKAADAGNGIMTNSTLALASKIDDEPAVPPADGCGRCRQMRRRRLAASTRCAKPTNPLTLLARAAEHVDWSGLLQSWTVRLLSLGGRGPALAPRLRLQLDFFIRLSNVPSPLVVLSAFIGHVQDSKFYIHILVSIQRILIGFALATSIGISSAC